MTGRSGAASTGESTSEMVRLGAAAAGGERLLSAKQWAANHPDTYFHDYGGRCGDGPRSFMLTRSRSERFAV